MRYAFLMGLLVASCGPGGDLVYYHLGGGTANQTVALAPDECILTGPADYTPMVNGVGTLPGEFFMEAAMDTWNARGAHFRYDSHGVFPQNDPQPGETLVGTIPVTCVDNISPLGYQSNDYIGLYSGADGSISIQRAFWTTPASWSWLCTTPWGSPGQQTEGCDAAYSDYSVLLAHELGHSLGMSHVKDVTAVMFWADHEYKGVQPQDQLDLNCAQLGTDCDQVQYDTENH